MLFLLLAAVALSVAALLFRDTGLPSPAVRVTRDGVLLEEIDLSQLDQPRTLTLEDERGSNTLQVERGRVRVSAADCPDQVCVNQGWISDGAVPIVCLPHRLMVEIVGGGGERDGGAG